MKIVFITRFFYPHIGGVEKHCLKLGRELIRKGHKVEVVTSANSFEQGLGYHYSRAAKDISTRTVDGITVYYIKTGRISALEKFRAWKRLYTLRHVVESADVVHCHDIFYWYLPFKFIFPRKKVFVTFHGYEGNKIPTRRAVFMHLLAEKLTMGNISIGGFFKKWYKTEPTYISFGAAEKKNVSEKKIKIKRIRAMFLGRLEEETGVMEYLEALSLLKDKKINVNLDVFGSGSLLKTAEAYVKVSKLNVLFKGFVSDAEKYIKNYDFVFTSRYLGILESLASKRYVFAVYNNEIKKDYLVLTPFAKFISIAAGAEQIAREVNLCLSKSRQLKYKIEAGFNWAEKYTWESLADLYLKLWRGH
jgi:glycosyltransferase involved in cell wall biosynthesis